jgi:hypothetical protein
MGEERADAPLDRWGIAGAVLTLYRNRLEYVPGSPQPPVLVPLRSVAAVTVLRWPMSGYRHVAAGGIAYQWSVGSVGSAAAAKEARARIAAALP